MTSCGRSQLEPCTQSIWVVLTFPTRSSGETKMSSLRVRTSAPLASEFSMDDLRPAPVTVHETRAAVATDVSMSKAVLQKGALFTLVTHAARSGRFA